MAQPMAAHWGPPLTRDLSTLIDPDLQQITHALQQRFDNQQIYTNIGEILVSVNPYRFLPIFGQEVGWSYQNVQTSVDIEPHIFMTACRAHRYLQLHGNDQTVLLSGEAGSGKTECVKMLVSQLGRLSGYRVTGGSQIHSEVAHRLSEALNLLDIFGNADTGLNNNSSRFGKFVDTYWDGNRLVGAEIVCQGLERSRVMLPGSGERNFHVFYRLLAGFDENMRRRHRFNQSYRILEPLEGGPMFLDRNDMESHRENYFYLRDCLKVLGIEQKMFRSGRVTAGSAMFEVLAAVLHLGNVHFAPDPESDLAFVANMAEVEAAASLMGLHVKDLLELILNGSKYSRGERVRYRRDVGEASKIRNSLVRFIYQRLFYWLVDAVNSSLAPTGPHRNRLKAIGILDLPGFENMSTNSLEQLHHNMAEERLQHHVTSLVFRQEIDDLERDGIRGHRMKVPGNPLVFDAFFNSDIGLLRLIDDRSSSHDHPDRELVRIITRSYSKNQVVQTDNTGKTFMVVHHRGQVIYSVDSLLAKNTPSSVHHFQSLLHNCQNPLLQEMTSRRRRSNSRDNDDIEDDDELSTTQKYAASLTDLFRRLDGRESQHIWCIRPNMTLEPGRFDGNCVARQLVAMNMVETAVIRARGYPVRLSHRGFLDRYKFIGFHLSARLSESLAGPCHRIIRRARIPEGGWEIRNKMVFLAWWHQDHLDTALERALSYVIFVQSRLRGFVARRRFRRARQFRREEKEELSDFFNDVIQFGQRTFYACQAQNDHNIRESERRYTGQDGGRRRSRRYSDSREDSYYNMYRNGAGREQYAAYIDSRPDEMVAFLQTVLRDVLSKWDIDPDTWAKVIFMEYDHPVGKLYVQNRELTIDGSYSPFDGDRVGIGVFRNPERNRETEEIRGHFGEGFCLRVDTEGNIWANRLTKNEVIVQGHNDPANHSLSADVILNKGRLPYCKVMKVFDMKELRSRIGLELRSSTFNRDRLLLQTIVCINLLAQGETPLDTPCWICVVNMVALKTIRSPDMLTTVERMVAQVELRTEEDEEKEEKGYEAKQRHGRQKWSRTDQRESLSQKESSRKIRMALRKKGESVGEHMDYSWNRENSGGSRKQITMDSLQGRVSERYGNDSRDPALSPTSPTDKSREWAKVKVATKSSKAKEESEADAMMKAKMTRY